MPLKLRCPQCDASVKARESDAGSRVECPECEALVKVPKAAAERSRSRDDEDDRPRRAASRYDEDDDNRRRHKLKGKKKKPSRGFVIGVVAGGVALILLLLIGGGIGAYYYFKPKGDKIINGEEWFKVQDSDGILEAYFPGSRPEFEKYGFEPSNFLAQKAGKKSGEELGFNVKMWTRREGGREYSITLVKFPEGGNPKGAEEAFSKTPRIPLGPGVTVLADDTVQVGGHDARRFVVRKDNKGQVSLMMGIGSRRVLMVLVAGDQTVDQNDLKVKAFFENLTVKQ
jgi:hypothetical protein